MLKQCPVACNQVRIFAHSGLIRGVKWSCLVTCLLVDLRRTRTNWCRDKARNNWWPFFVKLILRNVNQDPLIDHCAALVDMNWDTHPHHQQCSNKCDNNNSYCSAWANRGECNINPEYMDIYCRKVLSHRHRKKINQFLVFVKFNYLVRHLFVVLLPGL